MMKKFHIYTIILIVGFLLLPSLSYACGTKSEKACDKKEIASAHNQKDCCESSQSSDENTGCEGKCCQSKCGCSLTSTTSSASIFMHFNYQKIFNFSTREKVSFHYTTPSLSAGYSSIWLIPKLS